MQLKQNGRNFRNLWKCKTQWDNVSPHSKVDNSKTTKSEDIDTWNINLLPQPAYRPEKY